MAAIYDLEGCALTQGLQGSDTSDEALQTARRMAADRGEAVHLDDDDGEWLVDPDGSCDEVL